MYEQFLYIDDGFYDIDTVQRYPEQDYGEPVNREDSYCTGNVITIPLSPYGDDDLPC